MRKLKPGFYWLVPLIDGNKPKTVAEYTGLGFLFTGICELHEEAYVRQYYKIGPRIEWNSRAGGEK